LIIDDWKMMKNNYPSSIINNQSAKRPVVVLGLGNPLMADEGVGVYLIERLAERAAAYPVVDFSDAGTGGLALLHHLEGRHKAILIDCAFMNEPPGTLRRFTPDEVRSTKVLAHQSLHEADLLRVIAMARQLGQAPEEIIIFGVQPERIEPGRPLSPALMDRMDEYVSAVLHELEA
jgi:hydrogenase maturation protease